jgi:hypothetical protein
VLLVLVSAQGVTNAQSFSTPSSYVSFENPTYAVAADFDGDGKVDLVTANGLTDSVTFAFNNGTGSFPSRITYDSDPNPGWSAPTPLAIGDFNGDGKIDVAVGNGTGGTLSGGSIGILLNNGDRTFAFAVAYNASSPRDVAVADVNADGKLDVVAASGATDNVSVLLGNGNGTFQAFTTYPAADEPTGICIADFNGDAKPDLAVTHYSGNVLSILLGNGNGTFQAPVNYPAGTTPRGILAKDLNGDNKQDIVVAVPNSSAVYVYIGIGDGTFPAAVPYAVGQGSDVAIGDLNGDGKDDIATVVDVGNWNNPNLLKVLRGNGDGTFQLPPITQNTRGGAFSSTIADFDNDGKVDIAIVNPVFDVVDAYLNSPAAQGASFSSTADTAATNVLVATFKDYDATKTASAFSATINWGDGTPSSSATIASNGSGGFNVNGTHTYTSAGIYTVAVQVSDTSGNFAAANGSASVSANAPSITSTTTDEDTQSSSGLVISRHANDGSEVTHFKITTITNGTLFKSDGITQIANGSFITFAEGNAGLRFSPAANLFSPTTAFSFNVQAATDASGTGLSVATAAAITVTPIADTPSITSATTTVNVQTTSGLVVSRHAADRTEVTYFKITNITNGILFKNDGTTQITSNSFITFAEGNAGLKLTPANNVASPSSTFSFQAQGATSSGGAGLSPAALVAITVNKAATTTTVLSSVNPSEFGQSVTFTATVSSSVGVPTGSVQFKDGGTNLGAAQTLTGGVAPLTISSLTSGTHSISAEYLDNDTWIGSTGTLQDGQVVKAQPTLSISDVSVTEGNSGTTNLTFTVTLSAASNLTVSAGYSAANGTATSTDNDYQSSSGTVTFSPGDLTKTVTVVVNGDQKTEPDETVFVVLSNPVNAAFSDSQGQGTILNDDTLQLLLDTSGPDATQLAALDSLLLIRDPFRVQNTATWFTTEQNTRVILFALDLQLNPGDSASVVKVTLNGTQEVAADDVRTIAGTAFTQVTFRLPDGLAPGTCLVSLKAYGRISNSGTFRIVP